MRKLYVLLVLFISGMAASNAQTATWNLTTTSTPVVCGSLTATATTNGAGVSNVTTANALSGYSGTNFPTGVGTPGAAATTYLQYTVTNTSAGSLTLTNMNISTYYNGTILMYFAIRYSTNAFATNTLLTAGNTVTPGINSFSLTGGSLVMTAGQTMTFRVYGYFTDGTAYRFGNTFFQVTAAPPANPTAVSATAVSSSQINLNATYAAGNIIAAWNTTNTFGTPVAGTTYTAGNTLAGGGTILYNGPAGAPFYNHTGLNPSTTYYYKVWSTSPSCNIFSTGVTANATTLAAPVVIGTISATQQTGSVLTGSNNNNILRISIPATGSVGTQTLNSVKVTSENINDADIAASGVTLWTGTATAPTAQIGTAQTFSAGSVTFSGLSTAIVSGTTYLWIRYNISAGATINNTVDAYIAAGDITITAAGGATAMGASPLMDPAGNRLIVGPLCGGYTIDNTLATAGTNYNNFTDAINDLNARGVSCATTFSVKDGETFNELAPVITATGTAANTITFQRDNSTGTRPILSGTNGINTADAVIALSGTDYLTWDGINLKDNAANSTGVTQMEFGISLAGTAANGCTNNVFKNATITLLSFTATPTNTVGVSVVSAATSAPGANNNNKFYNLQISTCTDGYIFDNTATTIYDSGNEINTVSGGTSSVSNVGNTTFVNGFGMLYDYQTNFTIKNTSLTTLTGAASGGVFAIAGTAGALNTVDIENNTISGMTITGNTSDMEAIDLEAGSNTILMNNTIKNLTGPGSYVIGMYLNTTGSLQVTGNTFGGLGTAITASKNAPTIFSAIDVVGTQSPVQILNNNLSYITGTGVGASQLFTVVSVPAATITGNTLQNIGSTGNAASVVEGVQTNGTSSVVSTNTFSTFSVTTGLLRVLDIYGTSTTMASNTITGATATSGTIQGINIFAPTCQVNTNTIAGISVTTGSVTGIYAQPAGTNIQVTGNTLRTISAASTAAAALTSGIHILSTGTSYIQKNTVDNITNTGVSTGITAGIRADGNASTANIIYITNNMVSKVVANAATATTKPAVRGISLENSVSGRAYFNSVYLAGTGTGVVESAGLYTTTGDLVDSRDNIFYNAYAGTGKRDAIYTSLASATYFTNLNAASNNNVLYAGVPGASNIILANATADIQTVPLYVTAAGGIKESNTVTATANPFNNTATIPSDLHINTSSSDLCPVSTGVTVSAPIAVTDDIDADTRNNPPKIGADEFVLPNPTPGTITASINPVCAPSAITISDAGQSVGNDFNYQWQVDPGTGFVDITNTGVYSGATTTTLGISNTTGLDGYKYQLIVKRCSPALLSSGTNVITLTVNTGSTPPTSANATTIAVCGGTSTLTQTGGILGTGAYFQWYADAAFTIPVGGPNYLPNALQLVTPVATTTYYVRIEGGASPCSVTPTAAVSVTVYISSFWLGLINSDWFNALNWCGGVPTSTSDALIPPLLLHYPIIPAGTASVHTININAGASVTVNAAGIFSLYGVVNNSGTFDLTDGTLSLSATGVYIGGSDMLNSTLKNLVINNGGSSSISAGGTNMVRATGNVTFGSGSNIFNTNNNLTLVSSATATASFGDMTLNNTVTNTISGDVVVERYIGTTRHWQFLSIPTSTVQTVRQSWMEGGAAINPAAPGTSNVNNPKDGYGTFVTDENPGAVAAGFDAQSLSGPSVKYPFPIGSGSYQGITDPSALINAQETYFNFVRGPRNSDGLPAPASSLTTPTTLRTTGPLKTGPIARPISSGVITPVGNPYASELDMDKVMTASTGLGASIYVWDPKLTSGYGLGAFQTIQKIGANYIAVPGGGSYPSGNVNYIESGQAFFVQGAGGGNVNFAEPQKTLSSANVNFTSGNPELIQTSLLIRDASNNTTLLDGALLYTMNGFNNGIDYNDGTKINNTGENVSILSHNALLAIEQRQPVQDGDTVHLNVTSYRAANYRWIFNLTNMDEPGRFGFMVDQYTGTEQALDLNGTNTYDFTVVNVAGSYAANRFYIVFRPAGVVPVTFTTISAARQADKTILVKWNTENELSLNHYETERSGNGTAFSSIGSSNPTNNAGGSAAYSLTDVLPLTGDNYYRIKGVSNNGHVQYSAIVKVVPLEQDAQITVYPNPMSDRVMNVKFTNKPAGAYTLQLLNKAGQTVYSDKITVSGINDVKTITFNKRFAAGSYQLLIRDEAGIMTVLQVVME